MLSENVYDYDNVGNRTSLNGENYTYNAANMLLSKGTTNYTNDANGNRYQTNGVTDKVWDSQNRLTSCTYNGQTSTFTTYGADGLGSVIGEVDASGNVTYTAKYDVFGSLRDSSGTSTSKHKFVGGLGHTTEPDTGGLVYMRARWYDPAAGRFISEDRKKDGINWYIYCTNNPINLTDKTGNMADGETEYDAACVEAQSAIVNHLYRIIANMVTNEITALVGEGGVVAKVYEKTGQYVWYIGDYMSRLDLSGHNGTDVHFNVQFLEGEGHMIPTEEYEDFMAIVDLVSR